MSTSKNDRAPARLNDGQRSRVASGPAFCFAKTPRWQSSLGGDTRNAYDTARSPPGSSGGTAVAASFATVGLGTDTNGSLLAPAAAAGLIGVRPTLDLVRRHGVVAGLDDYGPSPALSAFSGLPAITFPIGGSRHRACRIARAGSLTACGRAGRAR